MNFSIELQILTNFLLILGLAFVANQISQLQSFPTSRQHSENKPVAWINGKSNNYDYLFHVINVLERLGYKIHKGQTESDVKWSLLWNHEYPFSQPELLSKIKSMNSTQYVNHIPGSGFVTSKVFLAQTPLKSGVPLSFSLPKQKQQLLDYAQKYPSLRWVKKNSNSHRGIEMANLDKLNLDQKDVFVQQFVENPLLIDGRKFDLGIYTVVTSLSPLRVYIYDGDVLLRFCAQPYLPFDPKNLDIYVIGDDYTPIWEMPSFHDYYNRQKLTARSSFSAYLSKQNVDSNVIWQQIQQIIREVFELNNEKMRASIKNYKYRGFFELTRFDFIIDEQYKVYLMEANMSPNLSSGHFKPNALLYEQVLFNLFSLVGLAGHLREESLNEIEVSDRDIAVELPECSSPTCKNCQNSRECGLCLDCMSSELRKSLRSAYKEHLNRRQMRRIVPSTKSNINLTSNDLLQRRWFEIMCREDVNFCA